MKRKILFSTAFLLLVPHSIAHAGFGDTIFRDWFIRPIQDFLLTLLQKSWEGISTWISTPVDLYQYEFIAKSIEVFQYIGFSLLAVQTANQIVKTMLSHSCGEGGKSMEVIVVDTIKSAILIGLSIWILEKLLLLNHGLIGVINEIGDFSLETVKMMEFDSTVTDGNTLSVGIGSFLLMAVVILIFSLGLLVLAIMATFRYGQLVVLAVLAPILAVSVAGEKDAYRIWIRESIAVVFTQSFQYWLLCFMMSIMIKNAMLRSMFDAVNFWDYLVVIGLLYMTIVAPSVLKKYLHSSGAGGAAMSTAKFGVYRAMMPKMAKLK